MHFAVLYLRMRALLLTGLVLLAMHLLEGGIMSQMLCALSGLRLVVFGSTK